MIRRVAIALLVGVAACAPRLSPLTGAPVPATRLPRTTFPAGHHKVVFTWELQDRDMSGRGEGVARIAAPDSARLDFFLAGGFGSGAAILIRDSIDAPGGDFVRRLVPPPTLLWAALGRVALPNLPDTVIRVDGPTLRADVGRPVAWRLTFRGDTLVRAERVDGGRVAEWVERTDDAGGGGGGGGGAVSVQHIHYRNESSRRSLQLSITRTEEVPGFDASTWRFDR